MLTIIIASGKQEKFNEQPQSREESHKTILKPSQDIRIVVSHFPCSIAHNLLYIIQHLIIYCFTWLPNCQIQQTLIDFMRDTFLISPSPFQTPVTSPSVLVDLTSISICSLSLTYRKHNGIKAKTRWKLVYSRDRAGYTFFVHPT